MTRREWLLGVGALSVAVGTPARLLGQEMAALEVASAGSFRGMTDGPLKVAARKSLRVELHSHAEGADAAARELVSGAWRADVFVSITPGPMLTVLRAGIATAAVPVARTEMALVYSPKSRYAAKFAAAKSGGDWLRVLQQPGIQLARGNPAGDPGGRNAYFVLMLAAKNLGQPEWVEKLLGSPETLAESFPGLSTQEKLASGELDAGFSYLGNAVSGKLPYLELPGSVNLGGDAVAAEHPEVKLELGGITFRPEPLVFYAAALLGAANAAGAAAFVAWLQGAEAQTLFRAAHFGAPGGAAALHA